MRKSFYLTILFTCLAFSGFSQELSGGTGLYNRYIWRGLDLGGSSASVQPWAKLSMGNENHSFALGALGAYSVSPAINDEVDLWMAYTFKNMLSLTLTDYFFPGLNSGAKNNFYEFGKDSTGHVLEGAISFNGTEKIPFTLMFAVNFFGNDARKANGDLFMSKYLEAGYKRKISGFDFNVFAGFALDKADVDKGEVTYYLNENPGLINLGIKLDKSIPITDKFSLPLQFAIISNPELDKMHLTFGIMFNMQ